jgi:hypothetical protein
VGGRGSRMTRREARCFNFNLCFPPIRWRAWLSRQARVGQCPLLHPDISTGTAADFSGFTAIDETGALMALARRGSDSRNLVGSCQSFVQIVDANRV